MNGKTAGYTTAGAGFMALIGALLSQTGIEPTPVITMGVSSIVGSVFTALAGWLD